jgi:hypothetical protein
MIHRALTDMVAGRDNRQKTMATRFSIVAVTKNVASYRQMMR